MGYICPACALTGFHIRGWGSLGSSLGLPALDAAPVALESGLGHTLGKVVRVHESCLNGLGNYCAIVHMLPEMVVLGMVIAGALGLEQW